ncbi:MAG: sulfide/dihydroorotate dehydrogenase-like FAD/NAD-binding protein [Dehalococcoidales bacterium]|nr:sulfide/dihydroorotate dehydrogenase-like FAD/NAD-binding protein [Dehalococcoidales bacterium]
MYRIIARERLAENIHLLEVEAPEVARKAQPGQFVVVRVDEEGERVPLTIADWDVERGSITIILLAVGTTTRKLAQLNAGDSILNFVGPLGRPTEIDRFGTVICVAGGVGTASIFPISRLLKARQNEVIAIMGARTRELIFWEDHLRSVSHQLIVTTDDGSYGRKGVVTEPLKEFLGARKVDRVIAIGPAIMMKFCSLTTKPAGVKTIVSLNPIMVDGTGMCGCCRVSVGGETKFACVDGPDFDGHKVDWDLLMSRQRAYLDEEKESLKLWETKAVSKQDAPTCHCERSEAISGEETQ